MDDLSIINKFSPIVISTKQSAWRDLSTSLEMTWVEMKTSLTCRAALTSGRRSILMFRVNSE